MMTKEEKDRAKKTNSIKYSHNRITSESAQQNEEWESISNNYQDDKYTYAVFRRKQLTLYINAAGWTRVYYNDEYIKTIRTWKELNDLEHVLFPGQFYYRYNSPKQEEEKISPEEFLSKVKPIKTIRVEGYVCPF